MRTAHTDGGGKPYAVAMVVCIFWIVCSMLLQGAPRLSHLDRSLGRILASTAPTVVAEDLGYHVRNGQVQVVIVTHEARAGELVTWLQEHGSRRVSTARNLIQADVDLDTLTDLEALPAAVWVRRPRYAEHPETHITGAPGQASGKSYTTQALAVLNGVQWQQAGYSGDGLKVGVIDTGFKGYSNLIGSELPAANLVHFKAYGAAGPDPDEPHGTACAEVIHDIAPGAELYLAQIETLVDVLNAMDWLRDEGVRVVSFSMAILFLGPGDGTGEFVYPEIADHALHHDMLWSMAGGNYGAQHWQGQDVDVDGDGWVEFSGGDELLSWVDGSGRPRDFNSGQTITVHLGWNDWTVVDQDLSIYLFRLVGSSREQVVVVDDSQDGQPGQSPLEYLKHTVRTSGQYAVGIFRKRVTRDLDLELFAPRTNVMDRLIPTGSICNPADSLYALTVTAISHTFPYGYFDYTSRGPANGPGGALSGGRILPHLTSYAEVDTASYGPGVFSGASSAAPHVAGAAALAWSARPDWSGLEVRRLLEDRARDLGPPGQDNDYGYGRLHLGDPPPVAAECVADVSVSASDFKEGGGTGAVTVNVADGCPWYVATYADWISFGVSDHGTGSGVASFTVEANSDSESRSAALMAAGENMTVTQNGHNPLGQPRRPTGRRSPSH